MKTNIDEVYRQLLVSNPNATDTDLVRIINRSDRGRFYYWVRFIAALVCRWAVVLVLCSFASDAVGDYVSNAKLSIGGLLGMMVKNAHWYAWIDLAYCIFCYVGYRNDPSGDDVYEMLKRDTYGRCGRRVGNYLAWTIIGPVLVGIINCIIKFA